MRSDCLSLTHSLMPFTPSWHVGKESKSRGGGYCLKFPCQYLFKGNLLAVEWLLVGGCLAKERKIVEDALARNQERKTGSIEKAAKE